MSEVRPRSKILHYLRCYRPLRHINGLAFYSMCLALHNGGKRKAYTGKPKALSPREAGTACRSGRAIRLTEDVAGKVAGQSTG